MKTGLFNKINTAATIALLSIVVSACAPQSKNSSSYQSSETQKSNIVGGTNATSAEQKQNGIVEILIFIQNQAGQQGTATCTGTLISKNIVLTAAHCLMSQGITRIGVVFATDTASATQTDVRFAVDGIVHPQFLDGYDPNSSNDNLIWNDIAILKLASDAPADFKFARLPTSLTEVSLVPNSKVTLAGYGITNAIVRKVVLDQDGKAVLDKDGNEQFVEIPSEGSGKLRKIENVTVKEVSADQKEIILDQSTGFGACHGDSGGPAFVTADSGSLIQVGITSRGTDKLGNCNQSAIYTSVASHLAWIDQASKALLAEPATPAPVAAK
jgi:secreted trypsin-like serine protease